MDVNRSSNFWVGRSNVLVALHELLFSANIACAIGYALSLYVSRSVGPWTPLNDAGYYFLRGAVRVSDILHLGAAIPVSTHAVARGESILWNQTALVTTFVVTVWSASAVVLLLVRTLALRPGNRATFRRIAGSAALFAAPACALAVWRRTGRGRPDVSLAKGRHHTLIFGSCSPYSLASWQVSSFSSWLVASVRSRLGPRVSSSSCILCSGVSFSSRAFRSTFAEPPRFT